MSEVPIYGNYQVPAGIAVSQRSAVDTPEVEYQSGCRGGGRGLRLLGGQACYRGTSLIRNSLRNMPNFSPKFELIVQEKASQELEEAVLNPQI
jgi:hypothetical protein